jgi:chromosome segregation ATPase
VRDRANFVALISLMLPLAAQAQTIYTCKDGTGKTFTSDRLIPECANRLVREMDKNGIVRREIPPPLTAEQKRQKQQEEERLKAEAAALEEQKQADRAMLARYRNENDIAVARKRTLELVQEQIKRETGTLAEREKDRKDVQLKIEQVGNKKPVPPVLHNKLNESDQSIAAVKAKIAAYQTEEAQINQKFDSTLKRYRELTGAGVTAASAPVASALPASPAPKK